MPETFTLPVAVYERMMLMLETATQSARDLPVVLAENVDFTDDFVSFVYNEEIEACQSIIDRVQFAYENRNTVKH